MTYFFEINLLQVKVWFIEMPLFLNLRVVFSMLS